MKEIGAVEFTERNRKDIWEAVDISGGYTLSPYDHIVVETRENFALSGYIGIRFWDNLISPLVENMQGFSYTEREEVFAVNANLICLSDGWMDPGYKGGFSRQPKWLTGRTIRPGDEVGLGQVFYFPKGVEREYGNPELGSQYK